MGAPGFPQSISGSPLFWVPSTASLRGVSLIFLQFPKLWGRVENISLATSVFNLCCCFIMCCWHCRYHNQGSQDTSGHVCTWGSADCMHSSAFQLLEHTKTIQGSFWCLGKDVHILSLPLKQKVGQSSQAYANSYAKSGLIHTNGYTTLMGQWGPALSSPSQLSVVPLCPNKPS